MQNLNTFKCIQRAYFDSERNVEMRKIASLCKNKKFELQARWAICSSAGAPHRYRLFVSENLLRRNFGMNGIVGRQRDFGIAPAASFCWTGKMLEGCYIFTVKTPKSLFVIFF